jgi:DNA-binding transcriptional regulator YhcF (GntR family)
MDAGYIMIPSVIVARQRALGLDAIDLAIILHLIRFWWERDNLPHPSVETIATLIDADRRTVQRRLKKLETAKLITRRARRSRFGDNDTNQYDFTGLIEAATPHAKAMIAERDEAIANKQRKNIRGRKRSTSGQEEQS